LALGKILADEPLDQPRSGGSPEYGLPERMPNNTSPSGLGEDGVESSSDIGFLLS